MKIINLVHMKIKEDGRKGHFILFNYPADVCFVVNGHPVTVSDILQAKRQQQARELATKRLNRAPLIKPGFVWTFYNRGFIYGGWWLYVQCHKDHWYIDPIRQEAMTLKIMRLFPCGYLPMVENLDLWKAAFAGLYHRPTHKRPDHQGMAVATVTISPDTRRIIDIKKGYP